MCAPCANDLEFRNAPGSDIHFFVGRSHQKFSFDKKKNGKSQKTMKFVEETRSCVVIGRVGEDRARKATCMFNIQEVRLGRERSWKANAGCF